jgi:F0F1-type ATP synthase membrane subunit b/b'
MDKIFLISSAALGFVFGAFYAAIAKMIAKAAKAILTANQKVIQAERPKATAAREKFPEKVKLPARVK